MKYKDTQNKVHDIEDGYQHLMAGWPDGYTEITDQEAADLLAPPPLTPTEIQAETNAANRAYLASTDWYVTRFAETGLAIPADILAARSFARLAIV